jgi:sodium/bile acid cotransporter 7
MFAACIFLLQGNVGLAIFLTVASNVVGVIFVPLWLKVMLSAGTSGIANLNINIADIFVKLLLSNFVPTVLGKLLRDCVKPVDAFVKRNRVLLSIINNTSLAFIIWQTLSSAREYIVNSTFGTMLLVFVSALLIHIIYLVFNAVVVKLLRVPVPEAISTIIMASQKSAPVAVTAISYITTDPVAQGLLAVPAVTGQLLQIFIGQPLAHYMEGKSEAWQQQQAKLQLPVVAADDELVVNAAGAQGDVQLRGGSGPQ